MNLRATATERIGQLGIDLPTTPAPLAAYAPAIRMDNLVFTAGQLPTLDGQVTTTGRVGADVDVPTAAEAAACALNAIAAISELAGSPDNIAQIVKVVGFVASDSTFFEQSTVIDGASTVLLDVFGEQIGRHSRSAVGVIALPRNATVEVEIVARIRS